MRVVEPHQFNKIKHKRKKKHLPRATLLIPILLTAGVLAYVFYGQELVHKPGTNGTPSDSDESSQSVSPPSSQQLSLKRFSDKQFKELYTSFAYPNTQPLTEAPAITGNEVADDRIQRLAEARGYVLSAVPVSNIVKIDEPYLTDDDLLQQNAKIGWDGLSEAADKAGVPLQITSAYRSIELQRSLFLSRMRNAGITENGVADGYSDEAINRVMNEVAPPGYSRHHNGYTIDLACDGVGLHGFKNTSCYEWISKDNFKAAKQHGWVPGYPEEASGQGPRPEPWEFIWVGTLQLYE
ncbi:MAG: D-alanyl-D-alanine carboxypeptidase family protein [Candidatus Saccharibacteria bacterium]|nr:D-alanyl-D-alanine carboxypeptidase family protein [Candidatus Saccharibacteria bacterium]